MKKRKFIHFGTFFTIALLLVGAATAVNANQPPQVEWFAGPGAVDLGEDLAELHMGETLIFADADDAAALLQYMGNIPNDHELGLVASSNEGSNWFIVFEYFDVGYVKDDEKDDIDAAAILASIREGTEKSNEIRAERGVSPLTIKGWYKEPYYDEQTHNLTWTVLAEQEGEEIVNHNIRLLGRHGFISAVLVTDVPTLAASITELDKVIANVSYKKGKSYAEYVKGDKVAKYGLTALIAGGSAAAAAKFGLFKFLAKAWKVLVVGVVAVFAVIRKKLGSLFGGKAKSPAAATAEAGVGSSAGEPRNDLPG